MPERTPSARTTSSTPIRALTVVVDVVMLTARGSELAVLVAPTGVTRGRGRVVLPSDSPRGDETLNDTALRVAREALGASPSMLDQAGTLGGARRIADTSNVTVAYFGLSPETGATARNGEWIALSELSGAAGRQREAIDAALAALRARIDQQPIAFRLLPAAFTLSELQGVYELLLGRRLHKASFRRSLHASAVVEATDEWRSEGRGRPAQLFRYSPPRRKRQRRGIRFDLL
jgi:8-oxo-dGTP diphosphatase